MMNPPQALRGILSRVMVMTALGVAAQALAQNAIPHSADTDGNGVIALSELLQVVQFYNARGFQCDPGTPGDFPPALPGEAPFDRECTPHDSDFITQDWTISLSELLRLIQLHSFGAYRTDCDSADGYAPGAGPLFLCGEGEGAPIDVGPGEYASAPGFDEAAGQGVALIANDDSGTANDGATSIRADGTVVRGPEPKSLIALTNPIAAAFNAEDGTFSVLENLGADAAGRLSIIDLAGNVTGMAAVGTNPMDVAAGLGQFAVANMGDDTVSVVDDTAKGTSAQTIDLADAMARNPYLVRSALDQFMVVNRGDAGAGINPSITYLADDGAGGFDVNNVDIGNGGKIPVDAAVDCCAFGVAFNLAVISQGTNTIDAYNQNGDPDFQDVPLDGTNPVAVASIGFDNFAVVNTNGGAPGNVDVRTFSGESFIGGPVPAGDTPNDVAATPEEGDEQFVVANEEGVQVFNVTSQGVEASEDSFDAGEELPPLVSDVYVVKP